MAGGPNGPEYIPTREERARNRERARGKVAPERNDLDEQDSVGEAKELAERESQRAVGVWGFDATPKGRARLAKASGQRFFQLVLPIENVDRTWLAKVMHEMDTRVKDTGDAVGVILTEVESEGWELIEAGFVFRETGGASRDKFLSSGQYIAVMGDTLGIYLFKARDSMPAEPGQGS
jgi:hypothetical protein